MHLGHRLHMFRRCLRDCKVRGWYFGNGCSKTWFDRQEYIRPDERSRKKCWYANIDIVPVIMAGIIGIYGLVVSVLISDGLKQQLPLFNGFIQLGAGLSVGLSGLAAGLASPATFWTLSILALRLLLICNKWVDSPSVLLETPVSAAQHSSQGYSLAWFSFSFSPKY